jgi:hypothetical protein
MENWYVMWQMGKARQQEFLEQAQHFRRVLEAGHGGKRYTPVYGALLSRLGEQLISWGSYLCDRTRTPERRDVYAGCVKSG